MKAPLHCPCEAGFFRPVFSYDAPPEGETRFFSAAGDYRREVRRCDVCAHYVSVHELELDALYAEEYVAATYGERLRETFDRIVALPPERSDNHWRVRRVVEFAVGRLRDRPNPSVLDIGSGLCVFLHGMKPHGWRGVALDPDGRAVAHARDVVGVEAVQGDYLAAEGLGRFDVVAFNKVLEHVEDPVEMLARSAGNLAEGGFVYVEVPDGEAARDEGAGREEFFIEHLHVFSPASLALLAERAGLSPLRIERLREPSTKFTLTGFLGRG